MLPGINALRLVDNSEGSWNCELDNDGHLTELGNLEFYDTLEGSIWEWAPALGPTLDPRS